VSGMCIKKKSLKSKENKFYSLYLRTLNYFTIVATKRYGDSYKFTHLILMLDLA
jgi:hypothetical protein